MQVYKRHACVSNVSKISLYAAVFTADKRRGRRSVLSRFAGRIALARRRAPSCGGRSRPVIFRPPVYQPHPTKTRPEFILKEYPLEQLSKNRAEAAWKTSSA
jgi:hypothetical protein